MSSPGDEIFAIEHLYFFVRVSTLQAICTISHSLRVEKIGLVSSGGLVDLGPWCEAAVTWSQTPLVSLQTMSSRDLSPEIHKALDGSIEFLSCLPFESTAKDVLHSVLKFCEKEYAETWPLKPTIIDQKACEALLSSQNGLKEDLHTAYKTGSYKNIRSRGECMSISPVISRLRLSSSRVPRAEGSDG